MKKIISLALVLVFAAFTLTACAPKECEACHREADTEKVEVNNKSAYLCESCAALAKLAGSLIDFD